MSQARWVRGSVSDNSGAEDSEN